MALDTTRLPLYVEDISINYTHPSALKSFPDVTIATIENGIHGPETTSVMTSNRAVLSSISPTLEPILRPLDPLEDITIITDLKPDEIKALLRFSVHGEISFLHKPEIFKMFGIDTETLRFQKIPVDAKWDEFECGRLKEEVCCDVDVGEFEDFDQYENYDELNDYYGLDDEYYGKKSTKRTRKRPKNARKREVDEDFKPPDCIIKEESGLAKRIKQEDTNGAEMESKKTSKRKPKKPKRLLAFAEFGTEEDFFEEDDLEGSDDEQDEQDFSDDEFDEVDPELEVKNEGNYKFGDNGEIIEDRTAPRKVAQIFRENERVKTYLESDGHGNLKPVMKVKKRNPVTKEWGPMVKLEMTETEAKGYFERQEKRLRHMPGKKEKLFFSFKERDPTMKYQCDKCNFGAKVEWDFREHTLRHERPEVHFCFLCEAGFYGRDDLKSHKKHVHKGSVSCQLCGQVFTRRGNLLTHLKSHEDGTWRKGLYSQCIQCGVQLKAGKQSHKSLDDHCAREGPFHNKKCAQCPAPSIEFETYDEHMKHINSVHGGQFLHVCGICHEVFKNSVYKNIHRSEVHNIKGKKTACPVCGELFSQVQSHMLRKHRIGGGEGVKCDECPKVCPTSKMLEQHKKTQHGHFLCELCSFHTTDQRKLKLHSINMHTKNEDKPFHCDTCGKGFASMSRLKQHVIIHTSLRPFKCDLCGKDYNDKTNLTHHVKSVHFGIKRNDKRRANRQIN